MVIQMKNKIIILLLIVLLIIFTISVFAEGWCAPSGCGYDACKISGTPGACCVSGNKGCDAYNNRILECIYDEWDDYGCQYEDPNDGYWKATNCGTKQSCVQYSDCNTYSCMDDCYKYGGSCVMSPSGSYKEIKQIYPAATGANGFCIYLNRWSYGKCIKCDPGYHLSGSTCVPDLKNNGAFCTSNSECVSGNCVSGYYSDKNVCCNQGEHVHNNGCRACSAENLYCVADLVDWCCPGLECVNSKCVIPCTANDHPACSENDLYSFDSCGNRENIIDDCQSPDAICTAGNTARYYNGFCHTDLKKCYFANLETCTYGCENGQCKIYVKHSTKACYNNDLYWYDSLGKRTNDVADDCQSPASTCGGNIRYYNGFCHTTNKQCYFANDETCPGGCQNGQCLAPCITSGTCTASSNICSGYWCSSGHVCQDEWYWNGIECVQAARCSNLCPYTPSQPQYYTTSGCITSTHSCCPVSYGKSTTDWVKFEIKPYE